MTETDGRVQVRTCGAFLDDPNFAAVRATINKPARGPVWPASVARTMNPQPSNQLKVTTQMDSVFFLADRFELIIDAKGYTPENIRCTITSDSVEVGAQADGKAGCIVNCTSGEKSRAMSRRYQLPQKIDPQLSSCFLSSDGILFVTAPWNPICNGACS